MKRVFIADNIAQAGLMRNYLEQHDIPSILRNEHTSGAIGDLPFVDNSPEIWVDASLHDRAIALINSLQQPANTDSSDWVCGACKEDNPSNFEFCWHCGRAQ